MSLLNVNRELDEDQEKLLPIYHTLPRDSVEILSPPYTENDVARPRRKWIWILHGALLGLNLTLAASLLWHNLSPHQRRIFSPVDKIAKYTTEYWDIQLGDVSPFTQAHNPKVDSLWNSISAPPGDVGIIKVTREDLEKANLTSVKYEDGSGYIATVDVFHQLHCLDQLRKRIYSPPKDAKDSPVGDHISHCIDSIRMSLQCSADTSLMSFKWIEGYLMPWPDFRSTHECRNWDTILEWTRANKADVNSPGSFVHPQLGPIEEIDKKKYGDNPLEGGKKAVWLDMEL